MLRYELRFSHGGRERSFHLFNLNHRSPVGSILGVPRGGAGVLAMVSSHSGTTVVCQPVGLVEKTPAGSVVKTWT